MENKITYEDFEKLDLRVATIIKAEDHPNADRLYVLKVSLGNEERQLVAGIRKHYTKEELIGKQIIIIVNLEPAMLRGIESQGMLLAAEDSTEKVRLLTPDEKLKEGAKVQ